MRHEDNKRYIFLVPSPENWSLFGSGTERAAPWIIGANWQSRTA